MSAAETGSLPSTIIDSASSVAIAAFTFATAPAILSTAVTNCCSSASSVAAFMSAAETGSLPSTIINSASSMRLWDSISSTTGSFDEG